jgi:hypothetical protein
MTEPVFLRPEAQLDLEDAAKWYNRQHGGLGYEFLDEVIRGFASISGIMRTAVLIRKT